MQSIYLSYYFIKFISESLNWIPEMYPDLFNMIINARIYKIVHVRRHNKAFLFSLSEINIVAFEFVETLVMPVHLKVFGYIGK